MTEKRRGSKGHIAVLMGGTSSEREISLRTGKAVARALKEKGYTTRAIDADKNLCERVKRAGADAVFIALHGCPGEDGTVQGLLELMAIPYTGSGLLSSALCMDKALSKRVLESRGIPTPRFAVVKSTGKELGPVRLAPKMSLPYVVKPSGEGSTIGVTIVEKKAGLKAAIEEAATYSDTVLIESFVKGREVTVSILNGAPLPIVEIIPHEGFYDFKAKYTAGSVDFIVPARLGARLTAKAQETALAAYGALGCRGAARVDIIIDRDGVPYVLEINTIPGMTETSLLPMAANAAGIDYSTLVEEVIKEARLG